MFVCFGILALTVAFLLGAQFGRAEYVDHSATGIVSTYSIFPESQYTYVLMDSGQVWSYDRGNRYWLQGTPDLPIPVSQIKFWGYPCLVSENNDLWVWQNGDHWENAGSPPGGVSTAPSTWGGIKTQFK